MSNIERKIVLSESEKAEKERMNVYYRDLLDKMKAIDEEIIYRKQLRKEDFRQDVDKLKVQKMVQRKEERLSQDLVRDK